MFVLALRCVNTSHLIDGSGSVKFAAVLIPANHQSPSLVHQQKLVSTQWVLFPEPFLQGNGDVTLRKLKVLFPLRAPLTFFS